MVFSVYKDEHLLFDIENDPWERNDMAEGNPDTVKRLTALYEDWRKELVAPKWLDPHGPNVAKEEQKRKDVIDAASRGQNC